MNSCRRKAETDDYHWFAGGGDDTSPRFGLETDDAPAVTATMIIDAGVGR